MKNLRKTVLTEQDTKRKAAFHSNLAMKTRFGAMRWNHRLNSLCNNKNEKSEKSLFLFDFLRKIEYTKTNEKEFCQNFQSIVDFLPCTEFLYMI